MYKLITEFVFEVGDIVFIRGALHCEGARPEPLCIQQQVAVRTDGGIQLLYNLVGKPALVDEIALTDIEPPYKPNTREARVDYGRMDALAAKRQADAVIAEHGQTKAYEAATKE